MSLKFLNKYEKEKRKRDAAIEQAIKFKQTLETRLTEFQDILNEDGVFWKKIENICIEINERTDWQLTINQLEKRNAYIDIKTHTPIYEKSTMTGKVNQVIGILERDAEKYNDEILQFREEWYVYAAAEVGFEIRLAESDFHIEIVGDYDGITVRWLETKLDHEEYTPRQIKKFDPIAIKDDEIESWFADLLDLTTGTVDRRRKRKRLLIKLVIFLFISASLLGGIWWWTDGFSQKPSFSIKLPHIHFLEKKNDQQLIIIKTANIRQGPSMEYSVITTLSAQTKVEWDTTYSDINRDDQWYPIKFKTDNGFLQKGWVYHTLVESSK